MRIELTGGVWYPLPLSDARELQVLEAVEYLTLEVTANSQGGTQVFDRVLGGDKIRSQSQNGVQVTMRHVRIYSAVDQVIYLNVLGPAWAAVESDRLVGTVNISDGSAGRVSQDKSFFGDLSQGASIGDYSFLAIGNDSSAADYIQLQSLSVYASGAGSTGLTFGSGDNASLLVAPVGNPFVSKNADGAFSVDSLQVHSYTADSIANLNGQFGGSRCSLRYFRGSPQRYFDNADPVLIAPGQFFGFYLLTANLELEASFEYTRVTL